MYACAIHACSASRGQKRALDPWDWSYKQLTATMWALELEPGSSGRVSSVLNL